MNWQPGNQAGKLRDPRPIYEELEKLEGDLSEEDAIYYLIKFLKENPTFAAQLIMGIRLYPFQHIMVKSMMSADYFLGVLSRGLSKTMTAGMFAAMYAIFQPGIKIGILSKTFRQAKGIIQKILDRAKKPEGQILASCITSTRYATDLWQVDIGQSSIVALPLGDGSRIRGFRFQCIIVDEFLLMPENIYKEVIIPFLGVVENPTEREDLRIAEEELVRKGLMKEEDRYKWPNNKLIALSSASYEFEYLYKLYSNYCNAILRPKGEYTVDEKEQGKADATRVVVQLGYGAAPPDLYDKSALDQARAEMSQAQIEREYGSIFTSDSSGYYRIKKIEEVSLKDDSTPCVEIRGDPLARYIVSIDPSWAKSLTSDDFAITVLKLNEELKISTMVHGYAMPGNSLKSHIDYLIYILENFNVCFIVGDYNGGQTFIDSFNECEKVREKKMQIGLITGCDFNDQEKFQDDVKTFKREYNLESRKICYLKTPTSSWIRAANELLSGSIENKKIWFANDSRNVPSVYFDAIRSSLDVQHLNFVVDAVELGGDDLVTPETKRVDLIENCYDIILLTKKQLALIEVKTTPQGTQTFDLNQGAKRTTGPNRQRKDSYSALLLGVWGHRIFLEAENFKQENASETFLPFFA